MTLDSTPPTEELSENTALRAQVAELERQLRQQRYREVALSATARVLQSIVDNVPYAIYWKDADLVYRGCNQHFAADLGLASASAIIGKADPDLPWRPEEVEGFRAIDRHVIETNTPEHDVDETTIHADGTQEWFETHKIPLHDQDGVVVGVLGTYANITERRRAEEAIRQSSMQQEIIAAQQAALRELSTPLIPILDGVVAMPLIGAIDSAGTADHGDTAGGDRREACQYRHPGYHRRARGRHAGGECADSHRASGAAVGRARDPDRHNT